MNENEKKSISAFRSFGKYQNSRPKDSLKIYDFRINKKNSRFKKFPNIFFVNFMKKIHRFIKVL